MRGLTTTLRRFLAQSPPVGGRQAARDPLAFTGDMARSGAALRWKGITDHAGWICGRRGEQHPPARSGDDAGAFGRRSATARLLPHILAPVRSSARLPARCHALETFSDDRRLALWVTLAFAPAAWGQAAAVPAPAALTIADAIALALANNRSLVSARLDREVQRFALAVAESEFRPQAVIGPFVRREWRDGADRTDGGVSTAVTLRVPTGGALALAWDSAVATVSDVGPGADYNTELTFRFTQPLLKGAGTNIGTADLRTARRAEAIHLLAFRSVIIEIVTSVVETYRAFVLAGRQLEIRERSLQRAQELLEVNRLLIASGRMAEQDMVQTEADVADRELDRTDARNRLDRARLALVDLLDIDSRTPIEPTESLVIDPVTPDLARSLDLAWRHRPDYQRARLRIENAETAVQVAANHRLWDLSTTFSASVRGAGDSLAGSFGNLGGSEYRAGLELRAPLGDLTLEQRHVNARVALRKARNDLGELRQRIEIEVQDAVRDVAVGLRQIELARRARELALQKLDIEQEKLNLGLTTNFQLVVFADNLVAAENREVEAVVSYLDALTRLDRTLGTTLETWRIDVGRAEAP